MLCVSEATPAMCGLTCMQMASTRASCLVLTTLHPQVQPHLLHGSCHTTSSSTLLIQSSGPVLSALPQPVVWARGPLHNAIGPPRPVTGRTHASFFTPAVGPDNLGDNLHAAPCMPAFMAGVHARAPSAGRGRPWRFVRAAHCTGCLAN